jgi:hypothetical protein
MLATVWKGYSQPLPFLLDRHWQKSAIGGGMSQPYRVFRLHFSLEGESREMIATGPHSDKVLEDLELVIPGAFVTDVEDLGLRSDFTDDSFAQLTETGANAKYGLP